MPNKPSRPHRFIPLSENRTKCDVCLRTKGPHDRAWAAYEAALKASKEATR